MRSFWSTRDTGRRQTLCAARNAQPRSASLWLTAASLLGLISTIPAVHAQLFADPSIVCGHIDAEFDRRRAAVQQAIEVADTQRDAWVRFEQAVDTAHRIMRAPCAPGVSGVSLQMSMKAVGPEVVTMMRAAADDLKPSLTVTQRTQLDAALQ
jgi:hypothetical protein